MLKLTEENLLKVLKEKGFKVEVEPASRQIFLTMRILRFEVPIFCGVRAEGTLLQTVAYLPYEINETTISNVARLLHLLNKECDIPGFGMDEKQKILFFRCVYANADKQFDPRLLELYLGTTRLACETFMEAIAQIASGRTTIDEVWNEVKKKK